ncbi:MAG: hypothetical protein DRP84_12315 [Spirochaetes bacterium]|nr:MAG: hypothetical protein DRP84_12315 [Spirochaetota bacterium]
MKRKMDEYSEDKEREKELLEEIESFREEKERIKRLIGSIGGKNFVKKDKLLNFILLGVVLLLFVLEVTTNWLPAYISLEMAVLLVSIKIVWLINNISKMDHFQFWILNSIEFRLNSLTNKLNEIDKKLN